MHSVTSNHVQFASDRSPRASRHVPLAEPAQNAQPPPRLRPVVLAITVKSQRPSRL